ncbi:DUF6166 domain-containing protein [Paracoccus alkanivorans]|uniref:Uncharacterized protein n=1 Tax=Paracoccus alkanivorans TaxID=2116655 RepID=A0A3M0MH69_9RHOB|nr:DUF6166 domain-containing protein [Paracoccus alkanivorans]RMC35704.1 hypothetical protein C9E81_10885 [Paracoccus alkanivorans]
MKIYMGDRTIDGVVVTVDEQDLPAHTEAVKFTDADFEWGFEGAAAVQLAFAILYDHTGDLDKSRRLSEDFMKQATANFGNEWEMTSADVDMFIERNEAAAG